MEKKYTGIICYAGAIPPGGLQGFTHPKPPKKPSQQIIEKVNEKIRTIMEKPHFKKAVVIISTSVKGATAVYGGAVAGQTIPEFHKVLVSEGPVPAIYHVYESLCHGKNVQEHPELIAFRSALRLAVHSMAKSERQEFLSGIRKIHGPDFARKLNQDLGIHGGSENLNWIKIYTQFYLSFLLGCFIFLFFLIFFEIVFSEIDELYVNSSSFRKSCSSFYNFFVPFLGYYKISHENYMNTYSYLSDEFFEFSI